MSSKIRALVIWNETKAEKWCSYKKEAAPVRDLQPEPFGPVPVQVKPPGSSSKQSWARGGPPEWRKARSEAEEASRSRGWSNSSRDPGVAWRWFWAAVGQRELGLHLGGPSLCSRRRREKIRWRKGRNGREGGFRERETGEERETIRKKKKIWFLCNKICYFFM